jgi:hypothetical protein
MKHEVVNVDVHDTLLAAMNDAAERAISVFGSGKNTLVDAIPQADWDSWDASAEKPNVADNDFHLADDYSDSFEMSAA